MYICPQCKRRFVIKDSKTFYRNSRSSDGFHSWCKKCMKECSKERKRKLNEEKRHHKLLNLVAEKITQRAKQENLPPSWTAQRCKELMSMTALELSIELKSLQKRV